jgi:photosystem II stability/assembly factor-like uncharacterized protein
MTRRERVAHALLAGGMVLLALTACNPFAPPPIAPTPTPPAEYIERANRSYQSGIDKLNRGDYRGAIQDLEDARVYMPAGDPRIADIDQALARARQALTPTAVTPVTVVPTPSGPPTPSRAVPNVALGDRTFGRVYPAVVPVVASVPPPTSVFTDSDQVAIYVPRLAEVTEFRLRVFRDPSGDFVAEVGSQAPSDPPVEWYDTLVWYHEGPEEVGEYRVELYAGSTLTNVLNFAVRQQIAQVPTPGPTSVPGVAVAPPPPPAPPAPPAPPPTAPPTPAPTATPRPPAPAALGDGQWRQLSTVEANGQNAGLVRSLVASPRSPSALFAATDKGVYRSEDGGHTWRPAQMPPNSPPILSLAFSPRTGVLYAAGSPTESGSGRSGIYRSTDGGATFDEYALVGRSVRELAFTPDGSALLAYTRPQGRREPGTLYRSTDEGSTWTPVLNVGDVNLIFTSIKFSPNYGSDRTLYVSAGSLPLAIPTAGPGQLQSGTQRSTYGTVFRSNDDGRTWLVRDKLAGGSSLASVWTLSTLPGGAPYTVYAGTDNGMAVSTTLADGWRPAADVTDATANHYVVDLVAPQSDGLLGVLCPQESTTRSPDTGGIEWKNCPTAVWNSGTGRWTTVAGNLGDSSSIYGKFSVIRGSSGPPAVYLGTDAGQLYLYSIPP